MRTWDENNETCLLRYSSEFVKTKDVSYIRHMVIANNGWVKLVTNIFEILWLLNKIYLPIIKFKLVKNKIKKTFQEVLSQACAGHESKIWFAKLSIFQNTNVTITRYIIVTFLMQKTKKQLNVLYFF